MGEVSIKRVAEAPGSKICDEIIAVFATLEIRDSVKRAAKEFAGEAGLGICLEIPNSLQNSLKALELVSFNLKKKHQKIKRSIKFDDANMDLVLDFNTDPENNPWRRITADQAKKMKQQLGDRTREVSDDELKTLLDS